MHISEFTRYIPASFFEAWQRIKNQTQSIHEYCMHYWQTKSQEYAEHELWKQYGKPFYKRNIEPIDRTDLVLLGGGFIAAALTIVVAINIFGAAILPLSIGAGALIISETFSFSRQRITDHFNDLAWDSVDTIRRAAHRINNESQEFQEIQKARDSLQQPVFNHLEEKLKNLDEKIREFRRAVLTPHYENQQQIVIGHLAALKAEDLEECDLNLIENLEKQIQKIGTKEQDFQALEIQKQSLGMSQSPIIQKHVSELNEQIKQLIAASQASFHANKEAFLDYLKTFQQELSPHKVVEELPRLDDEEIEEDSKSNHDEHIDDSNIFDEKEESPVEPIPDIEVFSENESDENEQAQSEDSKKTDPTEPSKDENS